MLGRKRTKWRREYHEWYYKELQGDCQAPHGEKMKNVAKRIKDLRKSKKLNQKEMAAIMDISRSAYAKIENGLNEVLSKHIVKIAEIFNVSTDWLLKGENNHPQAAQQGPDFNALGKYKEVVSIMVADMIENEYLLHSMCRFYFQFKAKECSDENDQSNSIDL